jgi:uncharacterized protein YndB with AHSA1/START domain
MTNRIEKTIELNAPVSRVWRALTHYKEFSTWFRVKLDQPFAMGETAIGQMTLPGHDHLWSATIQKMEPERFFSLTWHPYSVDKSRDYSKEPPTLVEFTLEKSAKGTLLRVVESGFDKIPLERRAEAFSRHDNGWDEQLGSIARHVDRTVASAMWNNSRGGEESRIERGLGG